MNANRGIRRRGLAVLLGSVAALVMAGLPAQAEDAAAKWQPHIDALGKLGTDRSLGGLDLFLPLSQDEDSLLFGNFRGRIDSHDTLEGSIGLGYRQMLDSGWNLGGYAFLDLIGTDEDNTFGQVGVGAEALSEDWDFRVNGYIPTQGSKQTGGEVETSGNTIGIREDEQRALYGADAEVGYRLPFFASDDFEIRVFGGGFYFDAGGYDEIAGPRARLEARLYDLSGLGEGSRLTLGAEAQYDDERDAQGFAVARLRIPLGSFFSDEPRRHLSLIERRMVDPVMRDDDVVVGHREGELETAVVPQTGVELSGIFYVAEGSHGTGDGSSPENAIDWDAFFALPNTENALVVAVNDFGDIDTPGTVLKVGHSLLGGGASLNLTDAAFDIDATFHAQGTRPVVHGLTSGTLVPVLLLANDTLVKAFDLRDGSDGARGVGVSNVYLQDLDIQNNNGGVAITGLSFQTSTDVTGRDITVRQLAGTGGDGTGLDIIGSSDVDFSGVDIAGEVAAAFGTGVNVDLSDQVFLRNFTIDTIGGSTPVGLHILASGTVTAQHFAIANIAGSSTAFGVAVETSNPVRLEHFSISGIDGPNATGLQFLNSADPSAQHVTIEDVTATATATGLDFNGTTDGSARDIAISGVGEAGVTGSAIGVHLNIAGGDVSLENVSVETLAAASSVGVLVEDSGTVGLRDFTVSDVVGSTSATGLFKQSGGLLTAVDFRIDAITGGTTARGVDILGSTATDLSDFDISNVSAPAVDPTDVPLTGGDGVVITNSTVAVNDFRITDVGDDAVELDGVNTLSGDGNVAAGFGDEVCENNGAATGSIEFDSPSTNCP